MTKKILVLALGSFCAFSLFFVPTVSAADCTAQQTAYDACKTLVCSNGEEAALTTCKASQTVYEKQCLSLPDKKSCCDNTANHALSGFDQFDCYAAFNVPFTGAYDNITDPNNCPTDDPDTANYDENKVCLDSITSPTVTADSPEGKEVDADDYVDADVAAAIAACKEKEGDKKKLECLGGVCSDFQAPARDECLRNAQSESRFIASTNDEVQGVLDAEATKVAREASYANCVAIHTPRENGAVKKPLSAGEEKQLKADCQAHEDAVEEAKNDLTEAQKNETYQAYEGSKDLAATADSEIESRAMSDAFKQLGSQTGFFDVGNISVGNEKFLEVGGADNNDRNILSRVINVMARLFGTVAVLMFVIGAFFMIVSQGDENQLQKGKTIVLYTIIGLLLGFTAYIIVQFVINMLFQT